MRGSYGEPGVKRESSAPYPAPRMPPNPNHASAASMHNMNGVGGPGQGGLPSPMGSGPGSYTGGGAGGVSGAPSMQTVTLDQVPFQRRPSPAAPGYQGPGGEYIKFPHIPFFTPPVATSFNMLCRCPDDGGTRRSAFPQAWPRNDAARSEIDGGAAQPASELGPTILHQLSSGTGETIETWTQWRFVKLIQ